MSRLRTRVTFLTLSLTAACVYPHTAVLRQPPPDERDWIHYAPGRQPSAPHGYYFPEVRLGPRNTNDLFVILAFSGGGTRAAALAYGVLDALKDLHVGCTPGR